jgi:hypothetical protein
VTTKLYCYVDETGQDTRGKLFLVAVVITAEDRDIARITLEEFEKESGKSRRKWVETRANQRTAYMKLVLSNRLFEGKLSYASYQDSTDYTTLTVDATAKAITRTVSTDDYVATVLVDALSKAQVNQFGVGLRRAGVLVRKVRGIKKEESDTLLRLADAVCGFTRSALEGHKEHLPMLKRALDQGYIRQVD